MIISIGGAKVGRVWRRGNAIISVTQSREKCNFRNKRGGLVLDLVVVVVETGHALSLQRQRQRPSPKKLPLFWFNIHRQTEPSPISFIIPQRPPRSPRRAFVRLVALWDKLN